MPRTLKPWSAEIGGITGRSGRISTKSGHPDTSWRAFAAAKPHLLREPQFFLCGIEVILDPEAVGKEVGGGIMTRAPGWRSATERETPSWSYAPSPPCCTDRA